MAAIAATAFLDVLTGAPVFEFTGDVVYGLGASEGGQPAPADGALPAAAAAAAAAIETDAFLSSPPVPHGLGLKCVRSYNPHRLHTILPGVNVLLLQLGGSVVWQL